MSSKDCSNVPEPLDPQRTAHKGCQGCAYAQHTCSGHSLNDAQGSFIPLNAVIVMLHQGCDGVSASNDLLT